MALLAFRFGLQVVVFREGGAVQPLNPKAAINVHCVNLAVSDGLQQLKGLKGFFGSYL